MPLAANILVTEVVIMADTEEVYTVPEMQDFLHTLWVVFQSTKALRFTVDLS
jgi:hypothetical protein